MTEYNDIDFSKEFEVEVEVEFETEVKVDVEIEKDIDVDLDLCDLEGNAATLSLDVQALGENGLAEVVSTVIATDCYASVCVEAGAYVA